MRYAAVPGSHGVIGANPQNRFGHFTNLQCQSGAAGPLILCLAARGQNDARLKLAPGPSNTTGANQVGPQFVAGRNPPKRGSRAAVDRNAGK
jgi:hypothetical protein